MQTTKERTVKEWLEDVAGSSQNSETDEVKMTNLLRRVGFGNAVCTCGIVYLEGEGTIEAPPMSIQSIARMILKRR